MKIYRKRRIGETHMSNEGYEIKVINGSYKPGHVVVSIDGRYEETVSYSDLVDGKVKNLYHKSVYDHGYIGVGRHIVTFEGTNTKKYITWKGILRRCYDSDLHRIQPTYKDAMVCDEWHNFQVFGEWYDNQYKEDGWRLDKDLLSGNDKVYSPKTCVFIPKELSNFLIRREMKKRSCPGMFDTPEADLAYRNNRLTNMMVWLKFLDNYQHIDRRAYEGMKVIYEEYEKERDILKKRINKQNKGEL